MLIVGGVGAGIVALLAMRNRPTSSPQSVVGTDGLQGIGGGSFDNSVASNLEAMESQTAQLNEALSGFANVIEGQQDMIYDLGSALDASNEQYLIFEQNFQNQLNTATESAIIASATSNVGDIYTDKFDDATQFNSIALQLEALNPSNVVKSNVLSEIAGTGNEGVGWTPSKEQVFLDNLNDSTFRENELIRTNLVIENRKAQGLDITQQEKHLKKVTEFIPES